MDRRNFTLTLSALGLSLAGCADRGGPAAPVETEPPVPPIPPRSFDSGLSRALGVADGLIAAAETTPAGLRWGVLGASGRSYPTDLYSGSAGVIAFLAAAYRLEPDDRIRDTLRQAGRWLDTAAPTPAHGLFSGNAGRAWAFLSLHEAVGTDSRWLDAALRLAPAVAASRDGLIGDIINGAPGKGLFLLRLYEATGDPQWRAAARSQADMMLERAVPAAGGAKYPSFQLADGRMVYYTGLAHGAAGAGYFLCHLARALPAGAGAAYLDGAEAVAAWLDATARRAGAAANWLRREPDQPDQQVQWCHGAPGIGLFYAELYSVTGNSAHLEMALRCAATVDMMGGSHWNCCLCHGVAGNASLYFSLHRVTGDRAWLDRAQAFETIVWSRRQMSGQYPAWASGDGQNTNSPALMTGTAGVGWFYLQLATEGAVAAPVMG